MTTTTILVLTLLLSVAFAQVCDVEKDYDAKGDGKTDNYEAFRKAFKACSKVVVPKGDFLIRKRLIIEKKGFELEIKKKGCMRMPKSIKDWPDNKEDGDCFLRVRKTKDVQIYGFGIIDGRGKKWWERRRKDKNAFAPTLVCVSSMNYFQISNVTLQDSPHFTLGIANCNNCDVFNLHVRAPEDAPNTDGIKVQGINITVTHNDVAVGDDNVAVNPGKTEGKPTKNVTIAHNHFGTGHGTSIGSVGKNFQAGYIQDVYIQDNTYDGTDNGFRVKTWIGGSGYVKNIIVKDLTMDDVGIPIYVNQKYCDNADKDTCPDEKKHPSAVQISQIMLQNIEAKKSRGRDKKGFKDVVAQFTCTHLLCRAFVIDNLHLETKKNTPRMICENAYGLTVKEGVPLSCIGPRLEDVESGDEGEPLEVSPEESAEDKVEL